MLRFEDSAATIDEPKTARMEQRTKAHVKELHTIRRDATGRGRNDIRDQCCL